MHNTYIYRTHTHTHTLKKLTTHRQHSSLEFRFRYRARYRFCCSPYTFFGVLTLPGRAQRRVCLCVYLCVCVRGP